MYGCIKKFTIVACLIFLSTCLGCGFTGELKRTEDGFNWKANRPCIIKDGDIEVDGKGQKIFELNLNAKR